jgi:hypothetical protein
VRSARTTVRSVLPRRPVSVGVVRMTCERESFGS